MEKLNNSYKPLIVAVFLAIIGFVAHADSPGILGDSASSRILIGVAQGAEVGVSADSAQDMPVALIGSGFSNGVSAPVPPSLDLSAGDDNATIQDPGQPVGQVFDTANAAVPSVVIYTVLKGDTLSGIAAKFGVSANSILSANPGISKKGLKVGTKINIVNPLGIGGSNTSTVNLPNFNANFISPAQGSDPGFLDSNNGVEIVNSCDTPVVAAADGIVVPDPDNSDAANGWNGGYGNFVLIKHAFGNDILTRYAHLDKATAQIGDYVKQGQEIGLMGKTGSATTCGVYFQVIGAQNPF